MLPGPYMRGSVETSYGYFFRSKRGHVIRSRASRIFLRKFVLHLHFVFASQTKITAVKKKRLK